MANVKPLKALETVKTVATARCAKASSPFSAGTAHATWKQYGVDGVYTHGLGDTDTV